MSHATLIKKRGDAAVFFYGDMERDEAAKSGLKLIPYSKYDYTEIFKQANQDSLLANAIRCQMMFQDVGVTSGRIGIYGTYDLSPIFGLLSHLQKLMPTAEFVGEAREDSIFMRTMETKDEAEVARIRVGNATTTVVGKVRDY
ncbi:MAG: hypothetical protein U0Z26_03710 [Anaerolineales bacterium]